MAVASINDGEIIVNADWTEKDIAAQVPGLNYDAKSNTWHGPLSWGVFVALCGIFQGTKPDGTARLSLEPELYAWYVERWDWYATSIEMRDKLQPDDTNQSIEAQQIRSWRTS